MEVPEYLPKLGDREAEAAKEAISSGWISPSGKEVERFEEKFTEFMGSGASVAVDSGTAALHLAIESLDLSEDSDIIVPDLTYGATGLAVKEAGMNPVLADIEAETLGIDPQQIEENLTPETEAVIVVHMYGRPAKMDEIMEMAEKHDLKVIEDAALSLGAEYKGEKTGSIGDIGCFSFAWNKNMTTGKGGMVFSSSEDMSQVRKLADYGREEGKRFEFSSTGYNYLMDNIRASVGLEQFERLPEIFERKEEIFDFYQKNLEVKGGLKEKREFVESTPTAFYILTDRKEGLKKHLEEHGIGCRDIFKPLNRMEVFPDGNYKVSEDIGDKGLVLPSHPDLSQEQLSYVVEKINDFFE
jgi:perosamine synthetase